MSAGVIAVEATQAPFQLETTTRCCVLQLTPQLNEVNWGDVEKVGTEILKRIEHLSAPSLVVDLSPLNYMGSAQVALLVRLWKSIKARDGRMIVEVPSPMVRKVLTIAGLHTLWELVDTRDEAFSNLGLAADGAKRTPLWPVLLAVVCLTVAIIGLVFPRLSTEAVEAIDPRVLTGVQVGLAGLALLFGLLTAVLSAGIRRGVGLGLMVASVLVGVMAALHLPR